MNELPLMPRGSILHWRFRHYVVFEGTTKAGISIVDPSAGRRTVPLEEFRRSFTGVALILEPGEKFEACDRRRSRGTVWRYLGRVLAHSDLLLRMGTVSLLVRLFGLAVPIMTGILVDRVIPYEDYGLLQILALGLSSLVVFNFFAAMVRAHVDLHLRTRLESELTLNFVDHLVGLPYEFFQSRTTGHLMVSMNSNSQIRDILTSSAMAALLDGSLAVLYLLVIVLASPPLAMLALGLGAARMALLVAIRRRQKILVSQGLEAQSRSQTYQMEMLNGIETLKSLGTEQKAATNWANLYVETLNVALEQGRLGAWFTAAIGALGTISPLAILGVGALQVLSGNLTLGTMLAMTALAGAFLAPLDSLVSTMTRFQLLSGYLERIDDVLETPREQDGVSTHSASRLAGRIDVEDISFRYGPRSPFVVRDVSVQIEAGTTVALVGRSGAGKSTLGKLLVGLHQPTEGRILLDDVTLESLECRSVRAQLGVVTQAPYLFSGSIRSNIALADPDASFERLAEAARLACIHREIMDMPMGYETMVNTGGLSLSGGQRQRIALARAFVRNPRIVLLDEATNQLDAVTERLVRKNLRGLGTTQVVIAHRLSTIVDADQILVMENGRIIETGTHPELLDRAGSYAELVAAQVGTRGKAETRMSTVEMVTLAPGLEHQRKP